MAHTKSLVAQKFSQLFILLLISTYFISNTGFVYAFYEDTNASNENQLHNLDTNFVKSSPETTNDTAGPTVEEIFLAPDDVEHLDWPVIFNETHSEYDEETGLLHVSVVLHF